MSLGMQLIHIGLESFEYKTFPIYKKYVVTNAKYNKKRMKGRYKHLMSM